MRQTGAFTVRSKTLRKGPYKSIPILWVTQWFDSFAPLNSFSRFSETAMWCSLSQTFQVFFSAESSSKTQQAGICVHSMCTKPFKGHISSWQCTGLQSRVWRDGYQRIELLLIHTEMAATHSHHPADNLPLNSHIRTLPPTLDFLGWEIKGQSWFLAFHSATVTNHPRQIFYRWHVGGK